MFKFLDRIQANRQKEQVSNLDEWRTLLHRAVFKDNLTDAEAVRLDALHRELGMTPDLATIAADLRRHHELSGPSGALAQAQAELAKAKKDADDHAAESVRIYSEHSAIVKRRSAEREAMEPRIRAATKALNAAKEAVAAAGDIESRHWRYFGKPDPAVVAAERQAAKERWAKSRFVIHAVKEDMEQHHGQDPHVLIFEYVLGGQHHGDLSECTFCRLDGQDPDEFAEMVAALKDPARRRYGYVRYRGEAGKLGYRHVQVNNVEKFIFEDAEEQNGAFPVGNYTWLRYPGQSRKELRKLVGALVDAWNKRHKNTGDTIPDDPERYMVNVPE